MSEFLFIHKHDEALGLNIEKSIATSLTLNMKVTTIFSKDLQTCELIMLFSPLIHNEKW